MKLTLVHEDRGPPRLDGVERLAGDPVRLKSLLETGTALSIPPTALGIEGLA